MQPTSLRVSESVTLPNIKKPLRHATVQIGKKKSNIRAVNFDDTSLQGNAVSKFDSVSLSKDSINVGPINISNEI